MRLFLTPRTLSSNTLVVLTALFVTVTGNLTLLAKTLHSYPPSSANVAYLASLAVLLLAANVFLCALFAFARPGKAVLIVFLLVSALAAYFMDSYGVVISDEMLRNAVQTNAAETLDLVTLRLFLYFVCLGVLPAVALARIPVRRLGWRREIKARAALLVLVLISSVAAVAPFTGFYASFVREHKVLRTYANPGYLLYSAGKFANELMHTESAKTLTVVGADARRAARGQGRKLVIMVVGEAARADRFALNGYARDTTPDLRAEKVVSFTDFLACGTSTAVSVPCMFSTLGMQKFTLKQAGSRENLLDVLQHAGVKVLWLDNNSDSKGVALRVEYKSYRSPVNNPVCDDECRDEGMLVDVQRIIDSHRQGDLFIVLHQMGNHGPAYYKRYPPRFEKFRPVCRSNELGQCSNAEIGNAYDNAILYTDYFLGKTIELLKNNDEQFATALIYVSDHGESLGENGLYLHGLPRAIAPKVQIHIPAVIWLGRRFPPGTMAAVAKKRDLPLTHDNLVHTVLGALNIETEVYRPELDILRDSHSDTAP